GHEGLDLGTVRHVGRHRQDVGARRLLDRVHRAFEHVLPTRAHGDLRAALGKPLDAGAAEPLATARDNCDLTGETELQDVHDRLPIRDCPNIPSGSRPAYPTPAAAMVDGP